MDSALFSIQPEPCLHIANGQKEWEFRTKPPKSEKDYKGFIYCTKGKKTLWVLKKEHRRGIKEIAQIFTAKDCGAAYRANGKVIGEFICDDVVRVVTGGFVNPFAINNRILERGHLSNNELLAYTDNYHKDLYALHISQLIIYDAPKELSEFKTVKKCKDAAHFEICSDVCGYAENNQCRDGLITKRVFSPPQSWCYVETL